MIYKLLFLFYSFTFTTSKSKSAIIFAGFPVLGRAPLLGHSDEVEVLGWARPSNIVSFLCCLAYY